LSFNGQRGDLTERFGITLGALSKIQSKNLT
jgi:hypothetical protein